MVPFTEVAVPPLPAIGLLTVLLAPLTLATLYVVSSWPFSPPTLWNWLVARKWGKRWSVAAAILPPCIAIAWKFEETLPPQTLYATVGTILFAVTAVQLYGQERNNRDRSETEARFADLFNEISEGRRAGEKGRESTEALVIALFDEIREARSESREERSESRVIAIALRNAIEDCENGICDIADAIATLAATAEEARENT